MTHSIRIAVNPKTYSDWPALLTLLRESFAYMATRVDPPSSLARMGLEEIRDKARRETLVLALAGEQPVGCAFATPVADAMYVGKMAVDSAFRGQGIARQLMNAIEALARLHGLPFIELQTRVELVENHRMFAALGFVKTGESAHVGYRRPTSITMRKPVVL